MGLIGRIFDAIFGNGRNVIVETAEVFRENAEKGAVRANATQAQTLAQFGREFGRGGGFDRFMDGINRIPRPALALGTLALFISAMVDPLWFAARMQGLAVVPEPLWWLLGVIVSFYFGARHQRKAQDFQRDIVASFAQAPDVAARLDRLKSLRSGAGGRVETASDNPALEDWHRAKLG